MSEDDDDTHSLREGITRSLKKYRSKLQDSSTRRAETAAAHANIVMIAEQLVVAANNKWRDEGLELAIASVDSSDSFGTMSNISVKLQDRKLDDCLQIYMKSPNEVTVMESHDGGSHETSLSAASGNDDVEMLLFRFVKKSIDAARKAI